VERLKLAKRRILLAIHAITKSLVCRDENIG
jgi:hypothetical protein